MEKLQPIIKQKFWILLGLALILSLVGWWMATSSMAAAIDTRKKAIDDAASKTNIGNDVPNDSWSEQLSKINENQEKLVRGSREWLWNQQTAVMTWPATVANFIKEAGYRNEVGPIAREAYRNRYLYEVRELWLTVRPMEAQIENDPGVVSFPFNKLPHQSWGDLPPTSPEMWDAQEDLWLMKPLLSAIREINGPNATRADATIHVIDTFQLVGGDRSTIGQSDQMAGDMMGGEMGGMPEAAFAPPGGGFGGAGMGGAGAQGVTTVEFAPKEEFGNPGGTAGGGMGGFAGSDPMMADPSMMGADGGGGVEATPPRRYIDDEEGQPYKTRGFYMSILMDHRQVPRLIAELTSSTRSPWPIEIVRVQMARVNDDAPGRAGGGGMMAGGGMGAPGMGGMEAGYGNFGGGGSLPESSFNMPMDAGGGGLPEYGSEGPMDPNFTGNSNQSQEAMMARQSAQAMLQASLQDPMTARVTIAGLIYLFTPPTATEAAAEEGSTEQAPAEVVPLENVPVSPEPEGLIGPDDKAPVIDPNTGLPVTTPAEGTQPANPETPAPGTPPAGDTPPANPAEGTPAPAANAAPADPASPPASPAATTETTPPAP